MSIKYSEPITALIRNCYYHKNSSPICALFGRLDQTKASWHCLRLTKKSVAPIFVMLYVSMMDLLNTPGNHSSPRPLPWERFPGNMPMLQDVIEVMTLRDRSHRWEAVARIINESTEPGGHGLCKQQITSGSTVAVMQSCQPVPCALEASSSIPPSSDGSKPDGVFWIHPASHLKTL